MLSIFCGPLVAVVQEVELKVELLGREGDSPVHLKRRSFRVLQRRIFVSHRSGSSFQSMTIAEKKEHVCASDSGLLNKLKLFYGKNVQLSSEHL